MDPLLFEIARRLVDFAKGQPYSGNNLKWKSAIFEILGNVGRGLGFEVSHGPCGGLFPNSREYLCDLIWRSNSGGIELAVECEFEKTAAIFYDFQKLAYVKSPLKMLIYTAARNKDSGRDVRSQIEGYMAQYTRHIAGEQYLFVEFGAYNDHRCYWYVAPNNGTVGSVSLLQIPLEQPIGAVSVQTLPTV
jgi:hypothetical protein